MLGNAKLLKVYPLIPEICAMVPKGLVFSADIQVHKHGKD